MRKKFWLITVLVFVLGVCLGAGGYFLWSTTLNPEVNSPAEKDNAAKVGTVQNGDAVQNALPDLSIEGNGIVDGIADGTNDSTNNSTDESTSALTEAEQEAVIAQYKQGLGILFDAWKAKDMTAFRTAIANAYTGELMEKHIQKAEGFISRGIGLDVGNIIFDDVQIESADKLSATVNAVYRYTARDYDLDEQYPLGEEQEHQVHVRANLIKIGQSWLITGETAI